jgi:hypothetical protein
MAHLRPIGTNGGVSIVGPDVTSSTPFNYSIVLSRLSIAVTRGLVAIGDVKFSDIKWTITAFGRREVQSSDRRFDCHNTRR